MKFCKNLQRVVDISDPEWAPYWTNYKMLKKLIKELPSLVPADDAKVRANPTRSNKKTLPTDLHSITQQQNHGYETEEQQQTRILKTNLVSSSAESLDTVSGAILLARPLSANTSFQQSKSLTSISASTHQQQQQQRNSQNQYAGSIGKSPGEVAFFKLLHSEFKKASHFFDRATEEFKIREERVREGMEIMRQPNSIMVNEKWALMAKSIYRLYKDLLLLETFAIMTYCSFSKILKKHDKVTGYDTRNAFMSNIVNKANFTHYPNLLSMITRCECFYEEVSTNLLREGKEGLYEDERLFINMISRLNEQVMDGSDSAKADGVATTSQTQRRVGCSRGVSTDIPAVSSSSMSPATSSLRTLVEENSKPMSSKSKAGMGGTVSEEANNGDYSNYGDDDDSDIDAGKKGYSCTKKAKRS